MAPNETNQICYKYRVFVTDRVQNIWDRLEIFFVLAHVFLWVSALLCVCQRCPVAGCQGRECWWWFLVTGSAHLLWSRSAVSVATSQWQKVLSHACWINARNKQTILTAEVIRCRYLLSFHSLNHATEKLVISFLSSFLLFFLLFSPSHILLDHHDDRLVNIPLLTWHLHSLISLVFLLRFH